MSDSYGYGADAPDGGSGLATTDPSGTVDTAKQEAVDLKDTATEQAKDVAGTAKAEVKSVATEAKTQAKDLYAQTRQELSDQAGTQQQRIAVGLKAIGNELDSMASNSDADGVGSDLVRQVSGRLSGAATWLEDRDPSSVLDEVKRYARRKPGTFIFGALVAGIVVGRLTRALAANASDEKSEPTDATVAPVGPAALTGAAAEPWGAPKPVADLPVVEVAVADTIAGDLDDTPIYAQSSPGLTTTEDGDVRRDTF